MTVRYRRPAALEGLDTRHAVVEASAGTGKTYVLEHLVVDLLLRRDLALEQILVVTFTEKATAELVERLRAKLIQLRDLGPEDSRACADPAVPDEACWIIDEPARRKLGQALLSFDRASICTIHAFCQRILTEYAFWHRRLFDEEVVDEADAFHAAFVETVRRDVAADPTMAPWLSAWLRCGETLEKLERLLATCRGHLASLHPSRDDALQPAPIGESVARELLGAWCGFDEARLRDALKRYKVPAASVRALLERLGRLERITEGHRTGAPLTESLVALENAGDREGDLLPRIADWLSKVPPGADDEAGRVAAQVHRLQAAIPALAVTMAQRILPRVEARLTARKREGGVFDFQDMLTLVARGLDGDGPRARSLAAALRGRFRHALIDEFQDTDEVQWSIFRRLFVDSRDGHTMTAIGDPKQAIYGFRGADVHTYLRAREEIVAGGGIAVPLEESFRATEPLVRAVNTLLDQEAAPPFFRAGGGILYDRPVRCGRPSLALLDAKGRAAPPVTVLSLVADAPQLLTWQVKQALKAFTVDEIRCLLSDEGCLHLTGGEPTRLSARDIFVLTRTVRESREIGEALRAARLPFAYYKQERLFQTVEAREVLDLLRAIADPSDRTARARAWTTGFFGLTLPEVGACDDLPPGHPLLVRLADWRALADAGDFEGLFARIVEQSGIVCREVFLQDERALTNYLHVLEILQEEASRSRGTIRELAVLLGAYVSGARRPPGQTSDIQRLETDAKAVQVMTIHHAKGLEAGVVFLYGAFWPGPRRDARPFHDDSGRRAVWVGRAPAEVERRVAEDNDDEERRVLYVALTRARGRLYLPFLPPAFKNLRGSYAFVNDRLRALLGGFVTEEVRNLFESRRVPCPCVPVPLPAASATALASWSPPERGRQEDAAAELSAIASTRAGFRVTSYSALKRRHGGFVPVEEPVEELTSDEADPGPTGPLAADELPRGRLSGSFLHELLEETPLDSLTDRPSLAAWGARPEVVSLFERLRRRHDRSPAHVPHALRLVHTALTAPLRLGPWAMNGIAGARHLLREVEFLYPIPEASHPGLARAGESWRIERGVVRGFIDVLFEHEGRTYVCDWKGDWLAQWEGAVLARHCARNYEIQARLYTLAALRLLGIAGEEDFARRFGGVVYCFLRGMSAEDPTAGIYFQRAEWSDVVASEREMLTSQLWGLS